MDTLKRLPFRAQKSVLDKLEKLVDIAAMSKEEREKYDESIRVYRDNMAVANGQRELGFEEGEKKGYDKGKKEGKEEGKKEGKEEGRLEEKRNVVLRMRDKGLSNEMISDFTGLSIEEIERLK